MSDLHRGSIRIVLVDGSELFRRGLKTVLTPQAQPPIKIVGEAAGVDVAVAECLRSKPDLVLLDVRLPDGSGFDACRRILEGRPETKIVVLTSYSDDNYVYEAVTSGACGYLMKEIPPAELIHAVRDVMAGRSILDPDAANRVLRLLRDAGSKGRVDLAMLSVQERRVLALVAEGLTNKQVGEKLGLSENTVKNYLVNVFEKLKVKRRAQAAAIYVQQSHSARI